MVPPALACRLCNLEGAFACFVSGFSESSSLFGYVCISISAVRTRRNRACVLLDSCVLLRYVGNVCALLCVHSVHPPCPPWATSRACRVALSLSSHLPDSSTNRILLVQIYGWGHTRRKYGITILLFRAKRKVAFLVEDEHEVKTLDA